MQWLAVYCGSNLGSDPQFAEQATRFADAMAARRLDLVYGGSKNGLMGLMADRLLAQHRRVVGVMPQGLIRWEQAHDQLTELLVVSSMHERKQAMSERADGFVALPGGIGTLEEIFEMISWAQLGVHQKPCAFFNVNGYYDTLISFLDHSVEQGLMRARIRGMILVDDQPGRLLEAMAGYRPPKVPRWIEDAET